MELELRLAGEEVSSKLEEVLLNPSSNQEASKKKGEIIVPSFLSAHQLHPAKQIKEK